MPNRGGPASRNAINPAALVSFVDAWSEYMNGGYPRRNRLLVNGTPITETDARMVRRWRKGDIEGVTLKSARTLLDRYGLTFDMLVTYCDQTEQSHLLRGSLPKTNTRRT